MAWHGSWCDFTQFQKKKKTLAKICFSQSHFVWHRFQYPLFIEMQTKMKIPMFIVGSILFCITIVIVLSFCVNCLTVVVVVFFLFGENKSVLCGERLNVKEKKKMCFVRMKNKKATDIFCWIAVKMSDNLCIDKGCNGNRSYQTHTRNCSAAKVSSKKKNRIECVGWPIVWVWCTFKWRKYTRHIILIEF